LPPLRIGTKSYRQCRSRSTAARPGSIAKIVYQYQLNHIVFDTKIVFHIHFTIPQNDRLPEVVFMRWTAPFLTLPIILLLLYLGMGSFPAWAQTGASLSGMVTDQNGAGLQDVAVTIRNVDTGTTRTTATDGVGHFQASGLPLGRFDIRAAKPGFADETLTGISLAVGQDTTVDIKMQRSTPDACASGHEFATTDCSLTWHGITVYGAYDVGAGWVSHGLPENGYNYEGESLVNRNGFQHRFVVAPNNLQQTGLGIRGKVEFLPGWFAVFNASTGINPQSGLLANASKTDIINNGLPRASYSIAIDGARAGQPFNDEYYGGVSSKLFGTLTFGRQRSLGTDAMLQYDPAPMPFPTSGITAPWPAAATPRTPAGMTR
jgi:hypothetical protein